MVLALIVTPLFAEEEIVTPDENGVQEETVVESRPEKPVYSTVINDVRIAGIEFWPFDDSFEKPNPYRERIIWGWSQRASEEARACTISGNIDLVAWLEDTESEVHKALMEFKAAGGRASFFIWTNDYQKAPIYAQRRGMRRSQVWYWNKAYLKYESTVDVEGNCTNPNQWQIVSYLQRLTRQLNSENN